MLGVVAVLLVLLAFVTITSSIYTARYLERLRAQLFAALEEQRQAFRQLRQAKAEKKLAEARREQAQRKCDELQQWLGRVEARLNALTEVGDKRKDVKIRGHRQE